MDSKQIRKVYVGRDDAALIDCHFCFSSRIINAAKYRNRAKPLRVRCTCGKTLLVSFEWRKAPRKETYFEGYWSRLPDCNAWNRMLVKEISETGATFTSLAGHDLTEGDEIKLRFTKNDRTGKETERTAVVRRVAPNNNVACQFASFA